MLKRALLTHQTSKK